MTTELQEVEAQNISKTENPFVLILIVDLIEFTEPEPVHPRLTPRKGGESGWQTHSCCHNWKRSLSGEEHKKICKPCTDWDTCASKYYKGTQFN